MFQKIILAAAQIYSCLAFRLVKAYSVTRLGTLTFAAHVQPIRFSSLLHHHTKKPLPHLLNWRPLYPLQPPLYLPLWFRVILICLSYFTASIHLSR
jgi:hypothetical protein